MDHIDGLVQDYNNPSVLAMGLLQSCTKPSIFNCTAVCREKSRNVIDLY